MELLTDTRMQYKTFAELLRARAQEQPDRFAFTYLHRGETEAEKLTYADLDRQARAIAVALQQRVKKGDRALMMYSPGLAFVLAFFGCLYAGIVPVPAYPPRRNQKIERLRTIVADAEAAIALTSQSLEKGIRDRFIQDDSLSNVPLLVSDSVDIALGQAWVEPNVDPESLAFLQYTSGSTGAPKGVMLSHRNLMHNSALICDRFEHTRELIGVIWLPPYHDMGLIGGVLQPIFVGAQTYLMSPMDFLQKPSVGCMQFRALGPPLAGGQILPTNFVCDELRPNSEIASI